MVLEVPGALLESYRGSVLHTVEFTFADKRSHMQPSAVLRSMRQTGLGSVRRLTNYMGLKVGPAGDELRHFEPQAGDVVQSDVLPDFLLTKEALKTMSWKVRNPDLDDPNEVNVYSAILHLNVHANVRMAHPGLPHSEHMDANWTKYFLGSSFLLSAVVYYTFKKRGLPTPPNVLDWSKTILPPDLFEEYHLWLSAEIPSMIAERMQ